MSTATQASPKASESFESNVNAYNLIEALTFYRDKIKVLSLDCFDTIILRKTLAPTDIFYTLQNQPTFKSLDFSAQLRMTSEGIARNRSRAIFGNSEIKLNDIYRASYPDLSNETYQNLSHEELNCEKEACFAYPPAMELIRAAAKMGLKIVVVSDIYFSVAELDDLLTTILPTDVRSAIHQIYCSSEYGKSKSTGLFNLVLKNLNAEPQTVLHIGDNRAADYIAPKDMKMHALHFLHHPQVMLDLVRMQALGMNLIDPSVRISRPLNHPYRGIMMLSNVDFNEADILIGYATLGPLMHAFAKMLIEDVKALKASGKEVKVVYLLRDAHLSALCCEAIMGESFGHRVRISRFSAYAASFRRKDDILNYLADVIASERFEDICKQLLLSEKTTRNILQKVKDAKKPQREFIDYAKRDDVANEIFKASAAYRQRLKLHLEKTVDMKSGDTLIFVDLGYTGTAQKLLMPVFREEMNVEIIGRYLLALRVPYWQENRAGLMDPSWCDDKMLLTLVTYIALLEQLSTTNEKSAIDFDEEGNAIYSDVNLNQSQFSKLLAVQSACIRFIKEAESYFDKTITNWPIPLLRDAALAALCRLIFLPTEVELEYLKAFEFDLNLGTSDILQVFDREAGLSGLRRRGLYFMEKNLKSMRTNYPSEVRSAGLELAITLITQHRFGLDFTPNDWSLRREKIQLILMRGQEATQSYAEAIPTHDGYFSMLIPLGLGDFQVGILWGERYEWLQIESIELIEAATLYSESESLSTTDASSQIIFDQMDALAGQLYHCLSPTGLAVFAPKEQSKMGKMTLRISYRPLVKRENIN